MRFTIGGLATVAIIAALGVAYYHQNLSPYARACAELKGHFLYEQCFQLVPISIEVSKW